MILRPGPHNFYIFSASETPDFIRHIAPVRKEQIPEYAKDLNQKAAPEFQIQYSVLKEWKIDDEEMIAKCIDHD